MKKLQNNFTTPEQSKRLLELGVPADSADCYYSRMRHEEFENPSICYESYSNHAAFLPKTFIYLPCWSVGRLVEIYGICRCYDGDWDEVYGKETLVETYVSAIEEAVLDKMFDFAKLEE